ncbi:unnamed protein product [Diamesa serratosioi]
MTDIDNIDSSIKSKRPSDSNFKQQRLPAWQPVLTASTVLPAFFVIGLAFIPVGITLLYYSNSISQIMIDYTDCLKVDQNNLISNITCAEELKNSPQASITNCKCRKEFSLDHDFVGDVFIYYGLSNFYQNHRRYVKSRDDEQLLGNFKDNPSSDCGPFALSEGKTIVPCGAIANSLFNDTLTLRSTSYGLVPVLRTGIAWESDRDIKFRNPAGDLKEALKNFARPIAWTKNLWELDTSDENNGLQNEDLIVWMRTAALPSFRKLYRRLNREKVNFENGLKKGTYTLDIDYNYPVIQFDGTKSFIISTTSLLGGKNPFLGYAYVVVGSLCLVLGIILLFIHLKYSRNNCQLNSIDSNTQRTPYT